VSGWVVRAQRRLPSEGGGVVVQMVDKVVWKVV